MPTATDAKRQKKAALTARANCAASSNGEKETARKLLSEMTTDSQKNQKERLTTTTVPDKIRVWTTEATLRKADANRLVHHKGLVWFLRHVKEGQLIDGRTIPLSKCFGSGDFYSILYWLGELGLVEKFGSRYKITSVRKIVSAWNDKVESLKIGV